MIKPAIATFLMSLFIFSCNNTVIDNTENSNNKEEHHHDDEPIVLDNGEKWKVDDNMMVHVQNMEIEINSFDSQNENDFAVLAKSINNHLDLLTGNCTMKGQAHDELHKWLLPFLDLSEEFSASQTIEEFTTNFKKIKTSFVTFNTYFK